MKTKNNIFVVSLFFLGVLFLGSCNKTYNQGKDVKELPEQAITFEGSETQLLHDFIAKSGDYINTKGVPNLISPENVYENLNNYLIIDIRPHNEYVEGHINGALSVSQSEILNFLKTKVSPSVYEKVIIVCHTGQSASYVTAILRLVGFDNVFAMKYGMSAWNRKLDRWSKGVSDKYIYRLETKDNPKHAPVNFPKIKTGKKDPIGILEARAQKVLNTPFHSVKINADEAFNGDYYIINYWPKEKYLQGHIPGAVRYTPKKELKHDTFLNTLPTDKKILVYCYTGQNAAFTIAYLRLLGYDAYTLVFGANSFMHSILVKKSWHGFKAEDKLNDFLLIEGEKPGGKDFAQKIIQLDAGVSAKKHKKIIKRKKKEVAGGCG